MKTSYHVQCRLRNRNLETVSWIPEKIAILGKPVRLKEDDGKWSVWERIVNVYHNTRRPTADVMARRNDHKNMRRMTDI